MPIGGDGEGSYDPRAESHLPDLQSPRSQHSSPFVFRHIRRGHSDFVCFCCFSRTLSKVLRLVDILTISLVPFLSAAGCGSVHLNERSDTTKRRRATAIPQDRVYKDLALVFLAGHALGQYPGILVDYPASLLNAALGQ